MNRIHQRFFTIRVIAAAFSFSVLIHGFVAVFFGPKKPPPLDTTLVAALVFMGIPIVGAGAFLAQGVYKSEFIAALTGEERSLSDALASRIMGQFMNRTLIGFALMEACALFGFVQIFLYGPQAFLPGGMMMAVALLSMLASFPNAGRLVDACEAAGIYPPKE